MRNIELIREVTSSAANRWSDVLAMVGITVPTSPRAQVACPACGGKDRFRFDDNGRGSHFCNQCGAGDGLDLIKKVNNCDVTTAAMMVADALGIDYRTAEMSEAAGQRKNVPAAPKEQKRPSEQDKRTKFASRYRNLEQKVTSGESQYLKAKGLTDFTLPVLPDGSLLLPLVDGDGVITGAQRITPAGEKRLLADSVMKGSFISVGAPPAAPETIIIAEGIATSLSVGLMCNGYVVTAINAGNLSHVAKVMRQKYPQAKIIIAADNDWHLPGETGRQRPSKKEHG